MRRKVIIAAMLQGGGLAPITIIAGPVWTDNLDGTATVTWTSSRASDSKVRYGATSSYGSSATNATLVTSHSITITAAGATYHFSVGDIAVTYSSTDSTGVITPTYDQLITTLAPSARWKCNDAIGATTLADSSGNGITLSQSGTIITGLLSVTPASNDGTSIAFPAATGKAVAASSATFDYNNVTTPITFMCTYGEDGNSSENQAIFSKMDAGGSNGYYILRIGAQYQFGLDHGASRSWRWPQPDAGAKHLFLSWGGDLATPPVVLIDGAVQVISNQGVGSPTTVTNTGVFTLGGRASDFVGNTVMQEICFWSGTALTQVQGAALYTASQIIGSGTKIPYISDNDAGNSDRGDLQETASVIAMHLRGNINLLGMCATAGCTTGAPALRACLDYYNLTAIPVGTYEGTDIYADGSTVCTPMRNQFRNTAYNGNPDVKSNPIYANPATFYGTALASQADASVVVGVAGFWNSVSGFFKPSGVLNATNVALWNQKVKLMGGVAGQWPNSSDGATPAGNFAAAGRGEWNLGGSGGTGPENVLEAQAAADYITSSTVETDWHGVQICGGTANSPPIATHISSTIPQGWSASNPIIYGFGAVGETSWDPMGAIAAVYQAKFGASNPLWTRTNITAPVIDTASSTAGQNTASAGATNHYRFSENTGVLSLTDWRTFMSAYMNIMVPRG